MKKCSSKKRPAKPSSSVQVPNTRTVMISQLHAIFISLAAIAVLVIVCCALVLSRLSVYDGQESPNAPIINKEGSNIYPNAISTAYEQITKSYKHCINASRDNLFRYKCGEIFNSSQKKLLNLMEKENVQNSN